MQTDDVMKICAIVQARMGSTRLPNKTIADIVGKPMLAHVVERLKGSNLLEGIIIATTADDSGNTIVEIAKKLGVYVSKGSEHDVLDRYYQAFKKYPADVVVRVSSDCPLIDPIIIDKVVNRYFEGDYDYVTNTLVRTYPDGLDVEVFSFIALEKAWKEAALFSEREHVTPYIWKNAEKFRLANVENEVNLAHLRWTVDQKEDLKFVREVYKYLYKEGGIFHMNDVLELLSKYPHLKQINQGIATNAGYAKSLKKDRIAR
jgi:spore coat polysaccharide biosynthesis protein SpsF